MTPETYARQEYNLLTDGITEVGLRIADPDVAAVILEFEGRIKARDQKRAEVLQELLGRVAGCPRTPRSCNDDHPGEHSEWCEACLLRFGMGIELPGL
jgi:hypothetical protein